MTVQHRVLKTRIPTGRVTNPTGARGPLTAWSDSSRRRLREGMFGVEPTRYGPSPVVVTLTYPGGGHEAWREYAPSGAAAKRHLRAFKLRWGRHFGEYPAWVWKLEFQRRGAPHFMLVTGLPRILCIPSFDLKEGPPQDQETSTPKGVIDTGLEELRKWVAETWWEVVGSGQASHLRAGTAVQLVGDLDHVAHYIGGYMTKGSKEYQHVIPANFEPGRWWGIDPALKADVTEVEVPKGAVYRVKRVQGGLRRSRDRDRRRLGAPQPGREARSRVVSRELDLGLTARTDSGTDGGASPQGGAPAPAPLPASELVTPKKSTRKYRSRAGMTTFLRGDPGTARRQLGQVLGHEELLS